jgi:4-hydroxy-tetrahydrodipicolinate synthase
MAPAKLKGVVVPTITPFRQDGELDEESLPPYLNFLSGVVHGLSVCAVYGSGILMSPDQRRRVAEMAVDVAADRIPVSVFVGAADTQTAVDLAQHAQRVGASAVSCVQPFYYRQVEEALYHHFKAIVEAVDLPVYAYDSPLYAGNQISLKLLDRLAEAGLAGVISGAATFGLEHLWSLLRNISKEGFDVWSIRDGLALPAMMMGAVGFESGVANFFPELVIEMHEAITERNYDEAAQLQQRALRLRDISHALGRNIPTLHALIALRGFETGVPKRPFYPLTGDEIARLRDDLRGLNFPIPLNLEA